MKMQTLVQKPTVLLVDDSDIDNFIHRMTLETSDFFSQVSVSNNPEETLDFLKSIPEDELKASLPGVIFLDIHMCMMSGFDFLDELEKTDVPIKKRCKIVLLSSTINKSDKEKAKTYSSIFKFIDKPL